MIQRLISSFTTKAAIGIAIGTFAAASAGAAGISLVSADHPASNVKTGAHSDQADDDTTGDDATVDEGTEVGEGTEVDDATVDDDAGAADSEVHPANFGAGVSADAQDGGVDGHDIADLAHARNDARKADTKAAADDATDEDATEVEADDATDEDATEIEADDATDEDATDEDATEIEADDGTDGDHADDDGTEVDHADEANQADDGADD